MVWRIFSPLQTVNVAYLQRKIQLSGISAYPDGSPSQLIRISGIILYSEKSQPQSKEKYWWGEGWPVVVFRIIIHGTLLWLKYNGLYCPMSFTGFTGMRVAGFCDWWRRSGEHYTARCKNIYRTSREMVLRVFLSTLTNLLAQLIYLTF